MHVSPNYSNSNNYQKIDTNVTNVSSFDQTSTENISNFNPSIIIDINSNILMRSEKLKKQITINLNIQLISYFIYLKNKNTFLAK